MSKFDDNQRTALVSLGLVCIFFLGVIIYSNIFNAPFVFDDNSSIVYNSTIKSLKNALVAISYNRYLGYLSFSVNYAVAGLNPFGYHVTNVLIHAANAASRLLPHHTDIYDAGLIGDKAFVRVRCHGNSLHLFSPPDPDTGSNVYCSAIYVYGNFFLPAFDHFLYQGQTGFY